MNILHTPAVYLHLNETRQRRPKRMVEKTHTSDTIFQNIGFHGAPRRRSKNPRARNSPIRHERAYRCAAVISRIRSCRKRGVCPGKTKKLFSLLKTFKLYFEKYAFVTCTSVESITHDCTCEHERKRMVLKYRIGPLKILSTIITTVFLDIVLR